MVSISCGSGNDNSFYSCDSPLRRGVDVNIGPVPIPAKAFWTKFWGLDGANTGVRIVEGIKSPKGIRFKKILGFAKTFVVTLFCNFSDGVVETHPDETVERESPKFSPLFASGVMLKYFANLLTRASPSKSLRISCSISLIYVGCFLIARVDYSTLCDRLPGFHSPRKEINIPLSLNVLPENECLKHFYQTH